MVYKPNEKPKLKTAKSKATAKQYDISLDELIKEYPNKINFLHRDIINLARKKYNKSNRQIPYRKFKPKNNKNNKNNINIDIKKVVEPKKIIPIKEKEIKSKKIKDVYIPYSQPFKVKLDQDKRGLGPEKLVRLPQSKKELKEDKKPVFKFEPAEKIPAPVNLLPDGEEKKINFLVKPKGDIEPYGTIKSAMFRASLGAIVEGEETDTEKIYTAKKLKTSSELTDNEKEFLKIKSKIIDKTATKNDYNNLKMLKPYLEGDNLKFAESEIQKNMGIIEWEIYDTIKNYKTDLGNLFLGVGAPMLIYYLTSYYKRIYNNDIDNIRNTPFIIYNQNIAQQIKDLRISEIKEKISYLDYINTGLYTYVTGASAYVGYKTGIPMILNEEWRNRLNMGVSKIVNMLPDKKSGNKLFNYIFDSLNKYLIKKGVKDLKNNPLTYTPSDVKTSSELTDNEKNILKQILEDEQRKAPRPPLLSATGEKKKKIDKTFGEPDVQPAPNLPEKFQGKKVTMSHKNLLTSTSFFQDVIKPTEKRRDEELKFNKTDSIDPDILKANDEANNIIGALTINDIKLDDINIFTEKYYRKIDPETKQKYDNAFNIWARENYRHLTLLREGAKAQGNHPVADDETIRTQAEEIKNLQDKLRQAQENRENIPTADISPLEQGERAENIPTATLLPQTPRYPDFRDYPTETFFTSGGGPAQTEENVFGGRGSGRVSDAEMRRRYENKEFTPEQEQAYLEREALKEDKGPEGPPPQGPPPQQGARAPPIIPDPSKTKTKYQEEEEINIASRGTVKGVAPPSAITSQIISGIDDTDDISEFPFLQPAINLWFHQYGKDWSRYLRDYKRTYTDRDLLMIGVKFGMKSINKNLYLKGIDILYKNWYNLIGVLAFNANDYNEPTLKELYIQLWAIITRYKVTPRQEVINALLYSDLTKQKQSEYSRSQNMGLVIDTKNLNQDQILNILRNQTPQTRGAPPQTGATPPSQDQGFGKYDRNIRKDLGSIEIATGRTIEDLAENKVKINYLYTPDAYYSGEHISKLPVRLPEVEPNKMLRIPPIVRNIKYFPISRKRNYNFLFEKNNEN